MSVFGKFIRQQRRFWNRWLRRQQDDTTATTATTTTTTTAATTTSTTAATPPLASGSLPIEANAGRTLSFLVAEMQQHTDAIGETGRNGAALSDEECAQLDRAQESHDILQAVYQQHTDTPRRQRGREHNRLNESILENIGGSQPKLIYRNDKFGSTTRNPCTATSSCCNCLCGHGPRTAYSYEAVQQRRKKAKAKKVAAKRSACLFCDHDVPHTICYAYGK